MCVCVCVHPGSTAPAVEPVPLPDIPRAAGHSARDAHNQSPRPRSCPDYRHPSDAHTHDRLVADAAAQPRKSSTATPLFELPPGVSIFQAGAAYIDFHEKKLKTSRASAVRAAEEKGGDTSEEEDEEEEDDEDEEEEKEEDGDQDAHEGEEDGDQDADEDEDKGGVNGKGGDDDAASDVSVAATLRYDKNGILVGPAASNTFMARTASRKHDVKKGRKHGGAAPATPRKATAGRNTAAATSSTKTSKGKSCGGTAAATATKAQQRKRALPFDRPLQLPRLSITKEKPPRAEICATQTHNGELIRVHVVSFRRGTSCNHISGAKFKAVQDAVMSMIEHDNCTKEECITFVNKKRIKN